MSPTGRTEEELPDRPVPHDVLGAVPTGADLRRELAAAARSVGRTSTRDAEISELRAEIADVDVPEVDLRTARERVAEATGEEERLAERVAAARGEVRARREVDVETDGATADLEDAAAALASARTERIAAEQAFARQRDRAATARDARERRLRLRDRLRNRRRDAREELAVAVYPAFRDALAAIPTCDPASTGERPCEYDGDPLRASLAAVRIADLDAPVALSSAAVRAATAGRDDPPGAILDAAVVRPDP